MPEQTHQCQIEGHGSLNFQRTPNGNIEVLLRSPDGGPRSNPTGTGLGKLKDGPIICSIPKEAAAGLIEYLKQFAA